MDLEELKRGRVRIEFTNGFEDRVNRSVAGRLDATVLAMNGERQLGSGKKAGARLHAQGLD